MVVVTDKPKGTTSLLVVMLLFSLYISLISGLIKTKTLLNFIISVFRIIARVGMCKLLLQVRVRLDEGSARLG